MFTIMNKNLSRVAMDAYCKPNELSEKDEQLDTIAVPTAVAGSGFTGVGT